MQRLANKIAVVTGGGGGIGSATVRRMVAEGAKVVVADINLEAAQRVADSLAGKAIAQAYDAADATSIESLMAVAMDHYGRIDILSNNTAITDPATQGQDTTVVDTPLDIWRKTLDINLTGYFVCCKFAIPHMLAGGGGSIINTASGSGMVGDLKRVGYGTSKAGIINLTRYIATQYGKQGIRCNAIAPGVVVTEALKRTAPEVLGTQMKHVLTPRLGTPEDIAALMAFLGSDESGYITGECIQINGGSLIHQPHFADYTVD